MQAFVEMNFLMHDDMERVMFEHLCIVCREFFPSRGIKNKHVIEQHKLLPCFICPSVVRDQEDLRRHHMEHGFFPCPHCNALWPSIAEMEYHVNIFHAISCKQCDEKFKTEENKEKHILADHFFKCKICQGTFPTIKVRDEHTLKFHFFVCSKVCKNTFKTDEGREMHIAATHSFKCIVCDGVWPTLVGRTDHVAKFHPEELADEFTTQVVNDGSNLEIYKSDEIIKKNQFFDEVVQEANNEGFENDKPSTSKFKTDDKKKQPFKVELQQASKEKSGTKSEQMVYNCVLCNQQFKTEQKHKWECPRCNKLFKREVNRNQHLEVIHIIECGICKKICHSEEMYLIHVKLMHHQYSK